MRRQGSTNDYRGDVRQLETQGVVIYTDGACIPNPGIGGWGLVVYLDGAEIHRDYGGARDTTNNCMEMTAVLQALLWVQGHLPKGQPGAIIYSDSQYTVKGTNTWCHSWARRGWVKAGGPIANLELWKWIQALAPTLPIKLQWVRGHAGTDGNELADQLAEKGRKSVKAQARN